MLWDSLLEVHTRSGWYRLRRANRHQLSIRPSAQGRERELAWFFLSSRFDHSTWAERQPLLELYAELTGSRIRSADGRGYGECPTWHQVLVELERGLRLGRLQFESIERPAPAPDEEIEAPPSDHRKRRGPPQTPSELWKRVKNDKQVHFEVRLVDETGKGIAGQAVMFLHAGETEPATTNGDGVATFDGVGPSSASVWVDEEDLESLAETLEELWQVYREPKLLEGKDVSLLGVQGASDARSLSNGVRHTLQFVPGLGRVYLELLDKYGRVAHAKTPYEISGPLAFSGTTDERGRLLHDDVPAGAYTLKLTVGDKDHEATAVVQPAEAATPQVRLLGLVPRTLLAGVQGFVFETNKSFVMPNALESMRGVRQLVLSSVPSELLVVGHCDTTGEPAVNDPLSLERADSALAMLLGDVDAWLARYDSSAKAKHRWGDREDQLMIAAMPDFGARPPSENPVRWFQRTRSLTVDGDAGPETRTHLIQEYMALVGKPLSEEPGFDTPSTTHGCGEWFPLDSSGEDLDAAPADSTEDAVDRRVDFFFFDRELGIQPPPPGKNSAQGSTEYPTWRKEAIPVSVGDVEDTDDLLVRLHDKSGEPLGGAICRLVGAGDGQMRYTADETGLVRIPRPEACGVTIDLEWGPSDTTDDFPYAHSLYVECAGEGGSDEERLSNLGYPAIPNLNTAVCCFQSDYGVDADPEPVGLDGGAIPAATRAKLKELFEVQQTAQRGQSAETV